MPALTGDPESAEFREAVMRLCAARTKLGGFPERSGNRAHMALMRWAEVRRDPVLFAELLEDFARVRKPYLRGTAEDDPFLQFQWERLEAPWKGEDPPQRTAAGRVIRLAPAVRPPERIERPDAPDKAKGTGAAKGTGEKRRDRQR